MIGNDLVDLNQAAIDSNWQRKGYLAKIFTLAEQQLILNAPNQNEMVWLLWSMKEAAYKVYSRQTGIRTYAPTSLNCFDIFNQSAKIIGKVKVAAQLFHTESQVNNNYIHTLAGPIIEDLAEVQVKIYAYPATLFDYKSTSPQCVSHHGKYLALIY